MFENVKAVVEIKVGDDLVSSVYVTNMHSPWIAIAENDRAIIDVTNADLLPMRGSEWTGSDFTEFSHHPPLTGYMYFAFIVKGRCVLVDIKDPADPHDAASIAAYKSNPSFEIHYA